MAHTGWEVSDPAHRVAAYDFFSAASRKGR